MERRELVSSGRGVFEAHDGVVDSYDPDAGLGVVSALSGEQWQFHCTVISNGTRSIEPGAAVRFRVGPAGPGRFEAFDVTSAEQSSPLGEVAQKG